MHKRIRPADEEMGGIWYTLGFVVLWYSGLLSAVRLRGVSMELSIFLIAGLLPLVMALQSIRKALFYRRKRKEAIQYGNASRGKIVGVMRQTVPYETSRHGTRYRKYYYLNVEVYDTLTGQGREIRSQGYTKPIHRYLRTPNVTVYIDQSGWNYYLEDFEWKTSRKEPNILPFREEFDESGGLSILIKVIFAFLLVMMLLNVFFSQGR